MPSFRSADETMRAIRREGIYEFQQAGFRQPDGTWLVEFDGEVATCLTPITLPSESVDDTIQRLTRLSRGDRAN